MMNMNPYQVGQATQNMANGNPGLIAAQQQQQQQMMADALRNQQIEPMNTTSAIPGQQISSGSQPQGGGGSGMPDLSKIAQMYQQSQQPQSGIQSLNNQTQGGAGPVAWTSGVTDGSGSILPSWMPSMSDVWSLFGLSDAAGAAGAADAGATAASSDSFLEALPEIAMMFA